MAQILLKISNNQTLQQFLHNCVDDLVGCNHINFDNICADIEWTKEDYQTATAFIQNLYRENVNNEGAFKASQVENLNERTLQCIQDCYEIRKEDILRSVTKGSLSEGGKLLVENIDWKLKWIMGSSKLATLREPLLQFDLHCFKNDGDSARKTINFEMNLQQVDQLIASLEEAKSELKGIV